MNKIQKQTAGILVILIMTFSMPQKAGVFTYNHDEFYSELSISEPFASDATDPFYEGEDDGFGFPAPGASKKAVTDDCGKCPACKSDWICDPNCRGGGYCSNTLCGLKDCNAYAQATEGIPVGDLTWDTLLLLLALGGAAVYKSKK